ncbi:sigma 54-interacting transcriptional regulator [uncultured Chitinophaga sp.]|jgi:Transcriptional regulator containing GAF, AAA-type ATPase, and DNA binding domains|uniref:sigma 54-interacting transcriptional regulator n=1 Tax=uncultured Chitinophaga sp. TaxID=339340 RepID=UPI00261E6DE4|nr:sigma 54-interacting transcriptional regulator [uncultured Chitinophaga sp.]
MSEKVLIVEDEFIVANDLRLMLQRAGYQVCGIAPSVKEAQDIIDQHQPGLVILDIYLKGRQTGIELAQQLKERHIAFVYLSANSSQHVLEAAKATEPYGFLVKPFREKDVLVTIDVARYRHQHSLESGYRRELLLQEAISQIITERIRPEQKCLKIARALQSYLPFDYMSAGALGFLRIGFDEYQVIRKDELCTISGLKAADLDVLQAGTPVDQFSAAYNQEAFEGILAQYPLKGLLARTFQLQSHLVVPISHPGGGATPFSFYSRRPDAYQSGDTHILERLQHLLAKLEVPGDQVVVSASSPHGTYGHTVAAGFDGIIGKSHRLLRVLDHVAQVAPFDTSVLITGESGTGKEKVARSIHQLSPRCRKPLVKVNCAALPSSLIESELFGYEKGAFTGAANRRIGKFEQADEGTIFLDEIGEMPLELQVKLLRVLQEKEIERIGGRNAIKVNVRIIAATNRNLEQAVAEGRFRLDLYYRLNVFPINMPPLRERREDIRLLADAFATQYTSRMHKPYYGIAPQMMDALEAWDWPGNIRELENVIEQSVILNDGNSPLELKRPLGNGWLTGLTPVAAPGDAQVKTFTDMKKHLQETERAYILSVLKKTNGRIRGESGAARILNLNPTTLESRIARLGIKKEDIS